jgi:hypothetical protein
MGFTSFAKLTEELDAAAGAVASSTGATDSVGMAASAGEATVKVGTTMGWDSDWLGRADSGAVWVVPPPQAVRTRDNKVRLMINFVFIFHPFEITIPSLSMDA